MPVETKGERIAGAYAYRQIYNFVADINAASYPQSPFETGGEIYRRLLNDLDVIEGIIADSGDDRDCLSPQTLSAIRCKARECVKSLSDYYNAQVYIRDHQKQYLDRFNLISSVVSALEKGQSVESIVSGLSPN